MQTDLSTLELEISLAISEEMAKAGEPESGLEFLRRYREEQPDARTTITARLLRYTFLHFETPFVAATLNWEKAELDPNMAALFQAVLELTDLEVAPPDFIPEFRKLAHGDWFWHYPLGLQAWCEGERELAWHHFERCRYLSGRELNRGGKVANWASSYLRFRRPCQACGCNPAEVLHWPSIPRVVALCPVCEEATNDPDLPATIYRGECDQRLLALASFRRLFDFHGTWESEPASQAEPPSSVLKYHFSGTLLRRLDEPSQRVFQQAQEVAQSQGEEQASSRLLLSCVLQAIADTMEPSLSRDALLKTKEVALRSPLKDGVGAIREVLNIAGWSAILENEGASIGLWNLRRGLGLTRRGVSSRLIEEGGAFASHCSPAQLEQIDELLSHRSNRYLSIVKRLNTDQPQDYQWLMENEPAVHLRSPLGATPPERVQLMLCWREQLKTDQSRTALLNADGLFAQAHPRVSRALKQIGYKLHQRPVFLGHFSERDPKRRRGDAEFALNELDRLAEVAKYAADRRELYSFARRIASSARLYQEAQEYAYRILRNPGAGPMRAYEQYSAWETLLKAAYHRKDYEGARDCLMQIQPPYTPNTCLSFVWLAQPLWRAGHRVEFHSVLERFQDFEGADQLMLAETHEIYRALAKRWTIAEVLELESRFLDEPRRLAARPQY